MSRGARREPLWRLFLNLSLTCAAGGCVLALIGAWAAAFATFGLGMLLAAFAYHRLSTSRSGGRLGSGARLPRGRR